MKGSVFVPEGKIVLLLDEWEKNQDAMLQKKLKEFDYYCYCLCISLSELKKSIYLFFNRKHGKHEKTKFRPNS